MIELYFGIKVIFAVIGLLATAIYAVFLCLRR